MLRSRVDPDVRQWLGIAIVLGLAIAVTVVALATLASLGGPTCGGG